MRFAAARGDERHERSDFSRSSEPSRRGLIRDEEAIAKLQPMEKTMILSQFASHEAAEALPPSTYLSQVGLGGRAAKWLKRAFLP